MHNDGGFRTRETIRLIAWRGTNHAGRQRPVRGCGVPLTPSSPKKGGTMMHEIRIGQRGRGAVKTRRAMVTWTKIACGAALTAALLGTGLVQPVAAQDDDTIVLTAG